MKVICSVFKLSRQAYYKHKNLHKLRVARHSEFLKFVCDSRDNLIIWGCRKLLYLYHLKFDVPEMHLGRDQAFDLLRSKKLLVKFKHKKPNTSLSHKERENYPNLLATTDVVVPKQAVVVDITYLRTFEGFSYLYLVSDLYSRKIIGHFVSKSLAASEACKALKQALANAGPLYGMIHHSDRGTQYRSEEYRKLLSKCGAMISVTGDKHCYDNAVAERLNGILKHEFGLGGLLTSHAVAEELAEDSIRLYNQVRPHLSLNYRTPSEVFAA